MALFLSLAQSFSGTWSLRLILQELEDCTAFDAFGLLAFSNGFGEGKVFELLDEVLT